MKFKDFINSGKVKERTPDIQLAKSMKKTCDEDLEFLDELEITEKSARKITTNYYDVARSLLEGVAALKGYKVYNHEAFKYFLKEEGENSLSEKFDRLRKIRNDINYYAQNITAEEATEHKKDAKEIIDKLKDKYFSRERTENNPDDKTTAGKSTKSNYA